MRSQTFFKKNLVHKSLATNYSIESAIALAKKESKPLNFIIMKKLIFAVVAFMLTIASLASSKPEFSTMGFKQIPPLGNDSTKNEKWNLDNHILFSVSTGALGGNRYRLNDNTSLKAPILITGERSGKFGKVTNLPNWLYYGFYFRYSKHQYEYNDTSNPYTIDATVIGAGVRASASVFTMAKDLGWDSKKMSRIDPYVGFQMGYDIISFDYSNSPYNYYYSNWGYGSGLRLNPMLGVRFFPTHWLGVQAEIGGTSNRFISAGIVIRA